MNKRDWQISGSTVQICLSLSKNSAHQCRNVCCIATLLYSARNFVKSAVYFWSHSYCDLHLALIDFPDCCPSQPYQHTCSGPHYHHFGIQHNFVTRKIQYETRMLVLLASSLFDINNQNFINVTLASWFIHTYVHTCVSQIQCVTWQQNKNMSKSHQHA